MNIFFFLSNYQKHNIPHLHYLRVFLEFNDSNAILKACRQWTIPDRVYPEN